VLSPNRCRVGRDPDPADFVGRRGGWPAVTSVGREAGRERRLETGRRSGLLRACTSDPEVTETREIFRWKKGVVLHDGSSWLCIIHMPRDMGPCCPPEFAVKLSSSLRFKKSLSSHFWNENGSIFFCYDSDHVSKVVLCHYEPIEYSSCPPHPHPFVSPEI
jgi:hypothetical protein